MTAVRPRHAGARMSPTPALGPRLAALLAARDGRTSHARLASRCRSARSTRSRSTRRRSRRTSRPPCGCARPTGSRSSASAGPGRRSPMEPDRFAEAERALAGAHRRRRASRGASPVLMGGLGFTGRRPGGGRRLGAVRRGLAGPAAAGLCARGRRRDAHRVGGRRGRMTSTGDGRRWSGAPGSSSRARTAWSRGPCSRRSRSRPSSRRTRPGTAWSACSPARSAAAGSTRWCSPGGWASGRPSSSTSRTPFAGWPRARRRARPTRSGATAGRSSARRPSASPEPTAARSGRWPSPGSIRRGADAAEDAALAADLLASEKDREEQAIVVDAIRAQLAPIAETLEVAPEPVGHDAAVRPAPGDRDLGHAARGARAAVARRAPAPDPGGRRRAARRRARADRRARGLRPRLVRRPDRLARARTATASCASRLRCGIVDRTRATLFAGCGIVADSDPAAEWEESRIKLRAVVIGAGHPGGRAVSDARAAPGVRRPSWSRPACATPSSAPGRGPRRSRWRCGRTGTSGSACCSTSAPRASSRWAWPGPSRPAGRRAGHVRDRGDGVRAGGGRGARTRACRSIVLTADRPAELRDRGAPQTIDQDHLYGRQAKWFAELPLFDGDPATAAHVRSLAGRAVATAARRARGSRASQRAVPRAAAPRRSAVGDEPAVDGSVRDRRRRPARRLDDAAIDALAGAPRGVRSAGLIVAGPDDDPDLPEALAALAASDRLPDPRGPAVRPPDRGPRPEPGDRTRGPARSARAPGSTPIAPDLVIRTGAMPTSKPIPSCSRGRRRS